MISSKNKSFMTVLATLVVIVTTLGLVACGDTATNTPASGSGAASSTVTTGSSTTASAMTTSTSSTMPAMSMAPGSSMTTASATTAAMTTASAMTTSSAMMTTPAMTAAAGTMTTSSASTGTTGNAAAIPTISGLTEVTLNANATAELAKSLKLTNANVKIYSSNDDTNTISNNFDTALTSQGYTFAIPGQTKPITQGDNGVGLYSKSGSDILFIVGTVPTNTDTSSASFPGLSKEELQQFADQFKGKKSLIIAISGQNLLQSLISLGSSSSSSSTTPGATTAGAMTTSAATPAPTK